MYELLLGILSSILASLIILLFKHMVEFKNNPTSEEKFHISKDNNVLKRSRQRFKQQFATHSWTAFVFFALVFFSGAALWLPLSFKIGFSSHQFDCFTTRLPSLCSAANLIDANVNFEIVALWIVFFSFVWYAAQAITIFLANFIHSKWRHVDQSFYRRIFVFAIMAMAFILSGHWIYFLYPPLEYWQAVILPFGLVALFEQMSERQRDRTSDTARAQS